MQFYTFIQAAFNSAWSQYLLHTTPSDFSNKHERQKDLYSTSECHTEYRQVQSLTSLFRPKALMININLPLYLLINTKLPQFPDNSNITTELMMQSTHSFCLLARFSSRHSLFSLSLGAMFLCMLICLLSILTRLFDQQLCNIPLQWMIWIGFTQKFP